MVAGESPTGGGATFFSRFLPDYDKSPRTNSLGIMSFETAKTMSRLISLYMSVSDAEIHTLKTETVRSAGVVYLNSDDEAYLLNLACSERLEDLDRVADVVARLGLKCSDRSINRFDLVYADLKQGIFDSGKVLEFQGKSLEKIISKMEKYVSYTSSLFAEMEGFRSMEAHERKIQLWKAMASPTEVRETNLELFEQKINSQRKEIRRLKKISLWNKTFEKCVSLMARVVCTVHNRIISVFGGDISVVPDVSRLKGKKHHHFHIHLSRKHNQPNRIAPFTEHAVSHSQRSPKSGPLSAGPTMKPSRNRFWSHELILPNSVNNSSFGFDPAPRVERPAAVTRVYQSAPPSTVGGSGLAVRYANVITVADRYLNSAVVMDDEQRGAVYEMLPAKLKRKVRTKVRGGDGGSKRREAVEGTMRWLTPVAMDTLRWQGERNLEKQNMDSKVSVLLFQTLHYSDLEKTEAVLVEVLVGLSFIFKHENHHTLFQ